MTMSVQNPTIRVNVGSERPEPAAGETAQSPTDSPRRIFLRSIFTSRQTDWSSKPIYPARPNRASRSSWRTTF